MKPLYIHSEQVHNFKAAEQVVPILLTLTHPSSILDVGCGLGTWLKVFEDNGVLDYIGLDGSHLNKDLLKIPKDKFKEVDLQQSFAIGKKFDLVICLEVAEHLSETASDHLIQSLVQHGDDIVFSAAIPHQLGQNHLNEQWPEYWEYKFGKYGYKFYDIIRPQIWTNSSIEWWYRQNIFFVSKKEQPQLKKYEYRSIVHPEYYLLKIKNEAEYLSDLHSGKQGFLFAFKLLIKTLFHNLRINKN